MTLNWCMSAWCKQNMRRDSSIFTAWHQPRNNRHSAVSTPLWWSLFQTRCVKLVIQSHIRLKRSESARKQRIALYKKIHQSSPIYVGRSGQAVNVKSVRLVSRRTSVWFRRFGSPLSPKVAVHGHCLVTLPLTINKTFKCLSSMPILMRELSIVYDFPSLLGSGSPILSKLTSSLRTETTRR